MGKRVAVSLIVIMITGLLFAHPAFAHNFVQNSDADLIAKIQEFKTESNLITNNLSNSTLTNWHISQSQQYWGANEMSSLYQKDSTLANNLSTSINDLYSLSGQSNTDPVTAMQKANTLNQILDQAESEEINSSDQNNATIQSLAIIGVLNAVLKNYGDAIGSKVDLTNMSNMDMGGMNMGSSSSISSGSMSGMSSNTIVNVAAYQSAQALTDTVRSMFNNLKSMTPSSSSPYLDKIGNELVDLKQAINSKESGNDVMTIVHMKIHPDFISGFNIQVIPEFAAPILLVIISVMGTIIISRFVPKLK
jgi:hypothetical protein